MVYVLMVLVAGCSVALWLLRRSQLQLRARLRSMEEKCDDLLEAADIDPNTGLLNRVAFVRHLEELISTEAANDLAVLFIDLERFKDVSESLGREAGDGLLWMVARRLQETLSDFDLLARLGGDELAAAVRLAADRAAEDVASSVARALEEPFLVKDQLVHVSTSIGIALATAETKDASDLLRQADAAMYEAKSTSGASFQIFDERMGERALLRSNLRTELQEAMRQGHMSLALQPVVESATGELASVEALLRWRHPERGQISPAEVIPMAEASGQILDLGAWVLERALSIATELGDVPVAVNVSPVQFRHHGFATLVGDMLLTHKVPPNLLRLEITEGVLITRPEAARSTIRQLRLLGVQVVLDDFGTGFSSLSYLQNLDFDCIKIDKSFLKDIARRPQAVQITRSVIELGRSLGMKIVAEGVENEWQARLMRMLKCDYMQGYYFGVPMSLEDILLFREESRAATRKGRPSDEGEQDVRSVA